MLRSLPTEYKNAVLLKKQMHTVISLLLLKKYIILYF
jgi:hypothetical protein